MEKQLKDYLHLYIGCDVQTRFGITNFNYYTLDLWSRGAYQEIRPILRPLSSITEEEAEKICFFNYGENYSWYIYGNEPNPHILHLLEGDEKYTDRIKLYIGTPEVWRYLLSKSFDLFGLIESGLAIDATTLQKEADNGL